MNFFLMTIKSMAETKIRYMVMPKMMSLYVSAAFKNPWVVIKILAKMNDPGTRLSVIFILNLCGTTKAL